MKRMTKVLTLVMALTLCVGLMTACTGGEENPTTKPGTSSTTKPDSDKNEGSSKPQESNPAENKPSETKPAESEPAASPSQNETTGK